VLAYPKYICENSIIQSEPAIYAQGSMHRRNVKAQKVERRDSFYCVADLSDFK
jgi:hypothetical protein